MKWASHKVLTFGIVLMVTKDPVAAFCTLPGAVFPDWVEGSPSEGAGYWNWRSRHRGFSHWFLLYLFMLGAVYIARRQGCAFFGYPLLYKFLIFFFIGALMHILEDAVCGKVPFIFPSKKYGIRLFSVGSFTEYLVVGAVLSGMYYCIYLV